MAKLPNVKPNIVQRLNRKKYPNLFTGLSANGSPKDKGEYLGHCNRAACLKPGANFYNHSTGKYYCAACAHWLNTDKVNKIYAMLWYKHDLCTEGEFDLLKFRQAKEVIYSKVTIAHDSAEGRTYSYTFNDGTKILDRVTDTLVKRALAKEFFNVDTPEKPDPYISTDL